MILRRFMKHITDQNWFAVGLDVIVVIVGIFLGLQVQAWYDRQNAMKEEVRILTALAAEVDDNIEFKTADFDRNLGDGEILRETLHIIFDQPQVTALSPDQCNSVAYSHILIWNMRPLLSVDELIGTGNFNIIRNEALRSKIMEHRSATFSSSVSNPVSNRNTVMLLDDFPEILLRTNHNYKNAVDCNLTLIREDKAFLNALQSNFGRRSGRGENTRTGGIIGRIGNEIILLEEIKALLNKETAP